jgi:hypothetical protein
MYCSAYRVVKKLYKNEHLIMATMTQFSLIVPPHISCDLVPVVLLQILLLCESHSIIVMCPLRAIMLIVSHVSNLESILPIWIVTRVVQGYNGKLKLGLHDK